MPRRYADYLSTDGFQPYNIVSTVGAFILGASMFPFVWNVFKSWRYGEVVTVDDPWATATRWSGPPVARRRGTTSPSCPESVRSDRHSSCTTRTWWNAFAPRRMSAGAWAGERRCDQSRRRQRSHLMGSSASRG